MSYFIRNISSVDPDYETIDCLGSGLRGSVYRVKRKRDGQEVACKQIAVNNVDSVRLVLGVIAEFRLLEGCRNVVMWHDDAAFDSDWLKVHVHMDKYLCGLDVLMKDLGRSPMSKEVFTQISASVVMALKDCHAKGICHRDIRPQNILLSKKVVAGQTVWVGHLTDFGVAKLVDADAVPAALADGKQWAASTLYMAPEALKCSSLGVFDPKSDVFSLGCTLWHVCNGNFPFTNSNRDGLPLWSNEASQLYGSRLVPGVKAMMCLDVAQRPSSAECEQFFKAYVDSRLEKQRQGGSNTSIWLALGAVAVIGVAAAARAAHHGVGHVAQDAQQGQQAQQQLQTMQKPQQRLQAMQQDQQQSQQWLQEMKQAQQQRQQQSQQQLQEMKQALQQSQQQSQQQLQEMKQALQQSQQQSQQWLQQQAEQQAQQRLQAQQQAEQQSQQQLAGPVAAAVVSSDAMSNWDPAAARLIQQLQQETLLVESRSRAASAETAAIIRQNNLETSRRIREMENQTHRNMIASANDSYNRSIAQRQRHAEDFINALRGNETVRVTWEARRRP